MCQREVTNCYSVLEERGEELQCVMEDFMEDEIVGKFGLHNCETFNFVHVYTILVI